MLLTDEYRQFTTTKFSTLAQQMMMTTMMTTSIINMQCCTCSFHHWMLSTLKQTSQKLKHAETAQYDRDLNSKKGCQKQTTSVLCDKDTPLFFFFSQAACRYSSRSVHCCVALFIGVVHKFINVYVHTFKQAFDQCLSTAGQGESEIEQRK